MEELFEEFDDVLKDWAKHTRYVSVFESHEVLSRAGLMLGLPRDREEFEEGAYACWGR